MKNNSKSNQEIIERLKLFLKEKFGSYAGAARELKITPQTLYTYFNKKSIPGRNFSLRLHKHGCDISWLYFGFKSKKKSSKEIYSIAKYRKQLKLTLRLIRAAKDFMKSNSEENVLTTKEILNSAEMQIEKIFSKKTVKLNSSHGKQTPITAIQQDVLQARHAMINKKISQSKLSKELNVTRQAVSYALLGSSKKLLKRINDYLATAAPLRRPI